jgi:hypothetical protein
VYIANASLSILGSIPGCWLRFSPIGQSAPFAWARFAEVHAVYSPLRVFHRSSLFGDHLVPSCVRGCFL